MTRLRRSLFAVLAVLPLLASADDLQLRPDHPDVYVVVRGDTLWDISGRFLTKPWYWPQLWGANPQIANPHLIYPGDRLRLVMTADGPRLMRDGQGHGSGGVSPQVRATPIDTAVPAIPLEHVQAFLEEAVVLHSNRASDFAYVASAADEHIAVGAGDRVYGRRTAAQPGESLDIFRIGDAYRDPESGEALGYNGLFIGRGNVQRAGDPATVSVAQARREVLAGDVLIPTDDSPMKASYMPHVPTTPLRGHIISVVDGVSQIGQYSVVVLSRGQRDGVELGHVLQVQQVPPPIDDPVARQRVQPPSDPAGTVMVFRLFERVSYALVMTANRPMHVLDEVTSLTPAAAGLALARIPGLGVAAWRRLLAAFGSPSLALGAPRGALLDCLAGRTTLVDRILAAADVLPRADIDWLHNGQDRQALFLDQPGYPPQLAQIADPPLALLVQGDARLLLAPQIAIVGSRNASPAGRETAFSMAAALAQCGLLVTSGLAEGVDGAAHRGALSGSGRTIAVLGTGPDRIYPRQHLSLAQEIRQRGALVSEQPVGMPPRSFNFPRRNRIISGLSLGVLVVEASAQSGSLITARQAADQGREVFAIPGGIHNPLARGCHALIRDGAKLVESVADILEELPPVEGGLSPLSAAPPATGQPAEATDPVLANIGDSPVSLDLLVARTGLTVAEVSTMLLTLQLDGLVTALPGGLYGRRSPHPAR